ncbi:hypothetical protein ACFXTI_032441 [Malus domestica]
MINNRDRNYDKETWSRLHKLSREAGGVFIPINKNREVHTANEPDNLRKTPASVLWQCWRRHILGSRPRNIICQWRHWHQRPFNAMNNTRIVNVEIRGSDKNVVERDPSAIGTESKLCVVSSEGGVEWELEEGFVIQGPGGVDVSAKRGGAEDLA